MFENAVHIGDPISSWGRCTSKSFSASSNLARLLKSQGSPFEFDVVRSSAIPGIVPSLGCRFAVAMTLGAECTSDTIALNRLVASRRYFRPHWPKNDTNATMSPYQIFASERSSCLNTDMAAWRSRLY